MKRERAVILARGLGTRMRQATDGDLAPESGAGRRDRRQGDDADRRPAARRGRAQFVSGSMSPAVPRLHPLGAGRRRLHRRLPGRRAGPRGDGAHYAGAGRPRRIRLAFAVQDEPIGTANAVAAAEAWTGDDPFLVINGDNYYAVRTLASLVGRAGAATALYRAETLVAQSNIPPDRIRAFALGVVEDGRLARIVEKPTPEQAAALGDTALVSMTCWRMPPAIHAACRARRRDRCAASSSWSTRSTR